MNFRALPAAVLALCASLSCERGDPLTNGPDALAGGAVRLLLTADVSTGAVPLTVSFTGTLFGTIDTLFLKVPEFSFDGGTGQPRDAYLPQPDTLAPARRVYPAREHYFQRRTFRAVMTLHGRSGSIVSDTCTISVE
jgi:hypothetical protein